MTGAHVQSPALHAQDRSATPLPLSAGKQQTRELTPSKINTITDYILYHNRGRYHHAINGTSMEHPMSCQWGIMEHPWNNPTSTCQWDILASSINNTHPAQYIHCISQFYSRGPALPEQSYMTDNLNNQQVQHAYLDQLNTHDM